MVFLQLVTACCLLTSMSLVLGQNCRTSFNRTDGNIVSKGATATADTDAASCESRCRSDSACKSYQLDTNTGHSLCWLQNGANPFDPNNVFYDRNITEYRKFIDCSSCPVIFVNFGGVTLGATAMINITSEQDCRSFCIQMSTCLSYQIDVSPTRYAYCWIQLNVNASRTVQPTVTEYTKQYNCSGITPRTVGFDSPVFGSATLGATPYSNLQTNDSCRQGCIDDTRCVSYQLNFRSGEVFCWLQLNNVSRNSAYVQPLIYEFFKIYLDSSTTSSTVSTVSGGAPCNAIFIPQTPGMASIASIPNTTFSTNDTCRQACFNDIRCVSYQLNTNNNEALCWFQFFASAILPDQIYTRPNVIEFFKICSATPRTISTQCTIKFYSHLMFLLQFLKFTFLCNIPNAFFGSLKLISATNSGGCVVQYRAGPTGQASIGAVPINAVTIQSCEAACTLDPSCLSYQINLVPQNSYCWHQRTSNSLPMKYAQPGVTEYEKFCAGSSSSYTTTTLKRLGNSAVQFHGSYPFLFILDFIIIEWVRRIKFISAPVDNRE